MRVLFIHSELQSLGIEYLAAALRSRGHEVRLIVDPAFSFLRYPASFIKLTLNHRKRVTRRIVEARPDLVAFSVNALNFQWACSWSEQLKTQSAVPVVMGGVHASFLPDEVFKQSRADYIIRGEGEAAICDLADGLSKGSVPLDMENLCYRGDNGLTTNPLRKLEGELDALPFPDKSMLPRWFNQGLYRIITSRGCAWRCSYCCAPLLRQMYEGNGRFVRRRSVDNVILELKQAKAIYKMRKVFFEDDDFACDKVWLRDFQLRYKSEIGLPCFVHATPATITEETACFLKEMQCAQVEIGVQTFNDKIRREVLKRSETFDQILNAVNILKEKGIGCVCDNIINLPGETKEDLIKMVELYNRTRAGKLEILPLQFYTGLSIVDSCQEAAEIRATIREKGHLTSFCDDVEKRQLLVLLVLTYVLPRRIIIEFLNRKWYRYLPGLRNIGQWNESLFYIASLFSEHRRRNFIGFRADEFFKLRYILFFK